MQVKYTRRVIGWLLVAVLLAGGMLPLQSAFAQDQNDEPAGTGRIFGYRTEMIFPAAVRFVVGLNARSDEVESVVLAVRQRGAFERSFTLDLALNRLPDQSTDLVTQFAYEWVLTDTPIPQPFDAVSFEWLITTTDGELSRASGRFVFVDDARAQWLTAGQTPLILHWLNANLAADTMREELLRVRSLLIHYTGVSPRTEFVIYDPQAQLCEEAISPETGESVSVVVGRETETQYPCSPADYRELYAAADMIFVQRQTYGYSDLQDMLVNAMARQSYDQLWGDIPVPAWFRAGIGSLLRLHPDIAALNVVRDAARTDTLIGLPALAIEPPDDAPYQQRALWEQQSYLLMLYLADRYGADAPFEMARDVVQQADGFEGALRALTGDGEETMWSEWLRWLYDASAMKAVEWTPYLAVTPTPTSTATTTPVPPTLTPSNTPTVTPLPTSTFLGDQPPTVIVQRVTLTRIPTTTNTPLPPGSLPTARPRDAGSSTDGGDGDSDALITGGLIALGVVGAALVLAGLVTTKRRR